MSNIIYEVTKKKTNIKGFWQDENGKVYIDNIKLFKAKNAYQWQNKIETMLADGEKAVFLQGERKSFVIYPNDFLTLTENVEFTTKTLTAGYIKSLLRIYKGLTIYRQKNGYKISIWKE